MPVVTPHLSRIVEIDQSRINVPDFPRDAAWWRSFLPHWFAVDINDLHDRQCNSKWAPDVHWEPEWTNMTIDPTSHIVSIKAKDRKHAQAIIDYLSKLHRLDSAVRLVEPRSPEVTADTTAAEAHLNEVRRRLDTTG